jgi:hypothetical protein
VRKIKKFAFLSLVTLPSATFAAGLFNFNLKEKPATGTLADYVGFITNWIVGIAGALAVLFIIYGGVLFITSAGNTKRVETAKKTLTYAIIGIAVILAKVVLQLLTGSFGAIIGTGGVTL